MSDRDPLEQLARFGTGGPVTPLPPAEVRRRGDRRRVRRTAVSAVAGVVAVLAVAVPAGLYAAHDSGIPPVPPSASTSARPTRIPDDFPLDRASGYLEGATKIGPSREAGMEYPLPCGRTGIESRPAADQLRFEMQGEEFVDRRELRTFDNQATASAVMAEIEKSVDACPLERSGSGREQAWTPLRAETGLATYSFSRTVQPMGGAIYQYTRVGRAILTVVWSGEGTTPEGARRDIGELSRITTAIAPEMCIWSDAGCAERPSDGATGGSTSPDLVFGPYGVNGLTLGMSAAEVRETGAASAVQGSAHDGWKEGCLAVDYTFTGDDEPGDVNGRISPEQGLEQLVATRDMRTPNGVGIGSTRSEVEAGFAHLVGAGDVLSSPAGDGSWAYEITLTDGRVSRITLELPRQDCAI